jgi:DNA-binding transcriptional LysR family regulator
MASLDDRVLRRLKLSDLRLFHAVVQSGGMARAAAQLHISQPAVSKAIAALEQTLGVRLLDRGPHGVEPTVYGRTLLDGGIAVFDELKQSVRRIEFLTDPRGGELRIGCSEPLAAGLVAAVLGKLSHEHPRASFHVVTGDPATLTERELRRRTVELALMPTAGLDLAADIDAEVLFDDRQVVMVGSKSKWLRRRNVALADLVDEPWLLPPADTIIGASIAETFHAAGLEPPRAHVVSFSIPLCHQLMATQRFLAMLPVSMARLGKDLPLKVLKVGIPGIARPTGIVTLKKRMLSPLARLFVDKARELAKPLS